MVVTPNSSSSLKWASTHGGDKQTHQLLKRLANMALHVATVPIFGKHSRLLATVRKGMSTHNEVKKHN